MTEQNPRFLPVSERTYTVDPEDLLNVNLYINWGGAGFGQLSVCLDRETGKLTCDNECVSREAVRKILHAMADTLADNVVLSCAPTPPPSDAEIKIVREHLRKKLKGGVLRIIDDRTLLFTTEMYEHNGVWLSQQKTVAHALGRAFTIENSVIGDITVIVQYTPSVG